MDNKRREEQSQEKSQSFESKSHEELKQRFQEILAEKFDQKKFEKDISDGQQITLDDVEKYRRKQKENDDSDRDQKKGPNDMELGNGEKDGLVFKASFKDGLYKAVGSNGHVVESKNMDDFHRQLAKIYKLNAMKHHKEPQCFIHINGEKVGPERQEEIAQSFAKNFINEGIVVGGDLPKSKEFWKNLKSNYLAQEGHDKETWDRLTRRVPQEYLKEKEEPQKKAPQQVAQKQQQKLTPEQLDRLRARGRG